MKCNLDERPGMKTDAYLSCNTSRSKHAFLKSTAHANNFSAERCLTKKNLPGIGFEDGFGESELDHSTDSASRHMQFAPNKNKFIQDMVGRFNWPGQHADDKVVFQKGNKMLKQGCLRNCDDAVFSKETEEGFRHNHTKSENSSDTVSSGRQFHPSKSPKPSPAPKPRKIPKDNFLFKNIFDRRTNAEIGSTKQELGNSDADMMPLSSCTISSSALSSTLCAPFSATSFSRSCGDLNRSVRTEGSKDCATEKPFCLCKSEEFAGDYVNRNKANDFVSFDDDSDSSDDDWENVNDFVSATQQTNCLTPSVAARKPSNFPSKMLVGGDSVNQKIIGMPPFDYLNMSNLVHADYVNETGSAISECSKNHNRIGAVSSDTDAATFLDDIYDPPYEIMTAMQGHYINSGFNEPSYGSSAGRVCPVSAAKYTSNDNDPNVVPNITDRSRHLDLRQLVSHPVSSPRFTYGSPVSKPLITSRGHMDGSLLSRLVLPPSPAPETTCPVSPGPPPITPRVPTRGFLSSPSPSIPSPSTLPQKLANVPTIQHSKSRRVPPSPHPLPITEVPSIVCDPCDDLNVTPPFVPKHLHSSYGSCATDHVVSNSKQPSAAMLKGYEMKCVEVDSGNHLKIARSNLSNMSSRSMNDLRRKDCNPRLPAPSGDETSKAQMNPSRSEGCLHQGSGGYMLMESQHFASSSSKLASQSASVNKVIVENSPSIFLPSRCSPTVHDAALSTKCADLNSFITINNTYLELCPEDHDKCSYLSLYDDSEPLYQHYHQGAVVRKVLEQSTGDDTDCDSSYNPRDYIERAKLLVDDILKRGLGNDHVSRENAVQGLSTLEIAAKHRTSFRKLWCEMPKVKESGLLVCMSPEEIRLQESLFEILSSEASYLRSLNLLVDHFMEMLAADIEDKDRRILSKQDFNWLFSNAKAVRSSCIKMLEALEIVWQQGCVIDALHLCSVITEVVQEHYGVYVTYCSNASYQERKLKELNESNPAFRCAVRHLEDFADCHSLPLSSFLVLPMQRITRMPLLVSATCRYLNPDDASSPEVRRCIRVLQKIVRQCNEGAKKMSNLEHINKISRILNFRSVKKFPLVSESRYLVKKGFLVHIIREPSGFLKKNKRNLFFFLFNDLLVITKKKSDKQFEVLDYAPRCHIHAQVISEENVSEHLPHGVPSGCRNLFVMALLDKHVELILSCETQSEQLRWIQAVTPFERDTEDEVIYADWDCPQVQAVMQFLATEPDELSLEESDIVNVLRKMNDGWYEGERLRDGERGWFPSSHTVEIQNAHVRARNLRQQYQLMKN